MPANTKMSIASVNAQANAMGAALNGGYVRLYGGVQPVDSDTATAEAVVATLRFQTPAFNAAVNGMISAKALASDVSAAGGTATWFRTFQADGSTAGWDDNVGMADEAMVLESNVIPPGAQVSIGEGDLTYEVPRS